MDAESYVPDLTTVEGCAEEIAAALCADSDVPPRYSEAKILAALKKDVARGASLPTKEEIRAFVLGGDDGEIPRDLKRRYRSVDRVLCSFY